MKKVLFHLALLLIIASNWKCENMVLDHCCAKENLAVGKAKSAIDDFKPTLERRTENLKVANDELKDALAKQKQAVADRDAHPGDDSYEAALRVANTILQAKIKNQEEKQTEFDKATAQMKALTDALTLAEKALEECEKNCKH
ncbi:hypothetical protein [Dyadobacter sp. LHD-138]|uniref:hypothetical protein n=1 Tax=Dyadobacter sp. LHD-138 TaxID=3071413 RepID=UPI0027E03ADF|nr:hypothetical protein [Dyadobacter sp. LHD-138]MDQ6480143.1 hypothetical protein [Dyadobacter sp. LHD-138]